MYLYFLRNLNPFEVLQIDPEASVEDAKKKFRRMSIMVSTNLAIIYMMSNIKCLLECVNLKM